MYADCQPLAMTFDYVNKSFVNNLITLFAANVIFKSKQRKMVQKSEKKQEIFS